MKNIKYLLVFISVLFLLKTNGVNALSISTQNATVYSGSQIAVYVNMTEYTGKFSITSNNEGVLAGGKVDWYEFQDDTVYFNAVNPGQAVVTIYSNNPSDKNGDNQGEVSKSITINVVNRPAQQQTTPIPINRTYSANNYLSGIAVTGYQLTPAFDKEVLEYNLEVDYTVEKINIETALEDSEATVKGAGEHQVSEGKNTFDVIVTAENGNERTYKVNVLVKEIDPIEITIDKEKYTIVKKDALLKEIDNYEKITTKIKDKEVPALKGKITNYILVGLKDSKGDINLYIYDDKNDTYTKYSEFKFDGLNIYPMEKDKDGYIKTVININGQDVTSYKKKGFNYYLIYGMNLDTGKTNWYTYDSEEKTIQRYIESDNISKEKSDNYLFLIYILSSVIGLLIVFIMILFIKYKKNLN